MSTTSIDLITHDPASDEFVLYLVEDGPWSETEEAMQADLRRVQTRLYDAIDIVIDGQLLERYPESEGKAVRIQVDSPSGVPAALDRLVKRFQQRLATDTGIKASIVQANIKGLRIVTGHEMGRFRHS